MKSKTFCIAPWVHALVRTDTTLRPCCTSTLKSNISFENYEDWWNGDSVKQLRQDLWTGVQSESCNKCWQDEAVGKASLRQNYNNMLSKFANFADIKKSADNNFETEALPTTWDLQIGNLCNLKCVMCNPGLSHQIANEQQKYADTIKSIFPVALKHFNSDFFTQQSFLNWSDTDAAEKFFEKINVDLKWLKLQGGEPLSVKNIKNLISNLSTESILSVITNGTILTEAMLKEFSSIKQLEISISVECAGPENNIIRYGSDWDTIHQNIQHLKKLPNVVLQINHVLQITSVFYLPDLIEFCEENSLHLNIINLTYPEYLSLAACPPKYLEDMLTKVDSLSIQHSKNQYIKDMIKNLVAKTKFDEKKWEQLKKYILTLDSIREKKYSSVLKFEEL